ncbi:MAG: hypothetical protein RMJ87_08010 [Cytophagales bacterium]|nr:hypothetical protein [Bernardetiaceae bacterium]MDW8204956.1 hypothetical protein [Cytophagales bacterium]
MNPLAVTYQSLAEGRAAFEAYQKTALPPKERPKLLAALKRKIVMDVYKNAYKADIEKFKQLLQTTESWLLPEGNELYVTLLNEGENVFSENLVRQGITFNYAIERRPHSNVASLTIKAVRNNMSNLVYNGSVRVNQLSPDQIEVEIPLSQNTGYMWRESKTDCLKVLVSANQPTVTVQPCGVMSTLADSNHGIAPAVLAQKVGDAFTVKNAIRSAMRQFIMNYPKALKMT